MTPPKGKSLRKKLLESHAQDHFLPFA